MFSPELKRPGLFAIGAAADSRRGEFDAKNESVLTCGKSVEYVFIGDSITHMWELQAYFGAKEGRLVLNRGIGGDVTANVLRRFDADVVQLKPQNCVIMIGVNDSWELEDDFWQTGREIPSLTQVLDNYKQSMQGIVKKCADAGIKLHICSILPINMPYNCSQEIRKEYILKANKILQEICAENALTYVDYYAATVMADGRTAIEDHFIEGLHPNAKGYSAMATALSAAIGI